MATTLRFIIIPKVQHPWFDEVNNGAQAQAEILSRALGAEIVVDYMPPSICDIVEQNAILENAAKSRPSGIAIDPVDVVDHMTAINRVRDQGIPVVLFDSPSPDGSITSVGNNFAQQGVIAAERLAKLIGYTGKVAVMQGYPTAPNHKERYQAQVEVLKKYQNITVLDGGIDNDDIETARQQASSVLESHPDLSGYLCCDASGPIGIATAIKEAGKAGKVKVVSMDGIKPILDAIKQGVIDSSSATIPKMQGSMSVLMLWQASLGVQMPQAIDTGIAVITQENVDRYLADAV
ncbi:MAG: sugar ABC transporter substrate-binding protein [Gammaproteobacteria bacterium]|nr:substrate-binding domain-containing protein [Gammaproteobacteria bacterium]NIN62420.1 substrate-binding domain-containing protein [Gammaproteobacteria bacterium]NIO63015.1 substrate-binding domain-containing protein [Gammaproteobacteria bacterium]NIP49038.1 sugar ABC transporter substrate-binding protein [Gammaproteobacteria bacterium]NIQ09494.1 sugar ABC transporter substrate-binding protein [Gammaproteobacteria bacterium]